jgi:plastocyanin
MTRLPRTLLCVAITATLGVAACGGDDDDTADSTDAPSETTAGSTTPETEPTPDPASSGVVIEGFAFVLPDSVPAGTVTVENRDGAPHTLTADDGTFDVSVSANASADAELEPGTYEVHCNVHPSMTGTLTVV